MINVPAFTSWHLSHRDQTFVVSCRSLALSFPYIKLSVHFTRRATLRTLLCWGKVRYSHVSHLALRVAATMMVAGITWRSPLGSYNLSNILSCCNVLIRAITARERSLAAQTLLILPFAASGRAPLLLNLAISFTSRPHLVLFRVLWWM